MKKKKFLSLFLCCITLIAVSPQLHASQVGSNASKLNTVNAKTSEELYMDLLASLLYPYIQPAVSQYYKNIDLVSYEFLQFLDIKNLNNLGRYYFEFKVKVYTFEGAHNYIGEDIITFRKDFSGLHVIDYQHADI